MDKTQINQALNPESTLEEKAPVTDTPVAEEVKLPRDENQEKVDFLIDESSKIAERKGFSSPDMFEPKKKLWLVVTELAEATEALRESRHSRMEEFEKIMSGELDYKAHFYYDAEGKVQQGTSEIEENNYFISNISEASLYKEDIQTAYFVKAYKEYVKDTFEAEVAGTLVRLGHFIGVLDLECIYNQNAVNEDLMVEKDFSSYCFNLTAIINTVWFYINFRGSKLDTQHTMTILLNSVLYMGKAFEFDVWKHVEWELKYFATRPHLHGKKF
jgi:hypothetical protein